MNMTRFAACREVEQVAALSKVRLRAGCFCNPGCCAGWLGLTADAMVANYRAGHVCWDDTDIVDGALVVALSALGQDLDGHCRAGSRAVVNAALASRLRHTWHLLLHELTASARPAAVSSGV